MADGVMEFRGLGTVEVLAGGKRVPLGGSKQRGLLAMLMMNVGRVVPLERLAGQLWPEQQPGSGTVYRLASRLRQALSLGSVAGSAPDGSILLGGEGGYRLAIDPEQVDIYRFENLLRDGRALLAAAQPEDAFHVLQQALGQWRGAALTGTPDAVRLGPGERLEELGMVAFEECAAAGLLAGRHEEVLPDLAERANTGPVRERVVGLQMTALQQSGRGVEALDLYRAVRDRLLSEQAMEPGELLREVHGRVLRGEAAVICGGRVRPVSVRRSALVRSGS